MKMLIVAVCQIEGSLYTSRGLVSTSLSIVNIITHLIAPHLQFLLGVL